MMNSMFNNNSPIVNNIMGGGYTTPNPIGNVIGIGNQGYSTIPNPYNMNIQNQMGGYYNNQYNNYYNPYLARQQQQLQEAQLREQMRQQTDILKSISKKVNNALGYNVDEEYLKQYDPENYYKYNDNYNGYVQDEDVRIHQQLMNIHCNGVNGNIYNIRLIQANNYIYEQEKKVRPDNMSMDDYHRSAGALLSEMKMQENRNKQRDLTKLYNVNQYNQLVKMNSNPNSYFNSMFNGTSMRKDMNIDDMEVKLPQHMISSYDERKKAFFDSIFNK